MSFDPERLAAVAAGGGLHLALGPREEEVYRRHGARGNAAAAALGTILSAWLVGEGGRLAAGLATTAAWLEDAERQAEAFGPAEERWFHRARRRRALALARWLSTGEAERAAWAGAVAAWRGAPPPSAAGPEDAIRAMRDSLLAGLPDAPGAVATLSGDPPRVALAAMGRELVAGRSRCAAARAAIPHLGAVLAPLLDGGAFIEAAAWLKLVFWTSGLRSDPAASLLAVYDTLQQLAVPRAAALARSAPPSPATRLRAALVAAVGENASPQALAALGFQLRPRAGRLLVTLPPATTAASWHAGLDAALLGRHLADALRGLLAGDLAGREIVVVPAPA
jgi:hypothetical protein